MWDGAQVSDIVSLNESVQLQSCWTLDFSSGPCGIRCWTRLVREALLALSSDWAFMVTKDSAADYARYRAQIHADRFSELAGCWRAAVGTGAVPRRSSARQTARSGTWTREEWR